MSYWDDSSDILQKGKEGPERVFPKPSKKNPNPIPEGATEFTPEKGQYAGVSHKVVPSPPTKTKGDSGLSTKEQKSHVWFKPPRGNMSYKKPPTVAAQRKDAKRDNRSLNLTPEQVKEKHEENSPSAWREFGDLTQVFGSGKPSPYKNPIPSQNTSGEAFRKEVGADLLSRQKRLQQNMKKVSERYQNSGGRLSSGAQVFKQMIERLPPKAQKEIMDTYSPARMMKLRSGGGVGAIFGDKLGAKGLQLKGLPSRFKNKEQYKKLAGFYYNPNGFEYSMSLK
jgi:hypothetical protein